MESLKHSEQLAKSLLTSQLLVDELDGVVAFNRELFSKTALSGTVPEFSFQQKLGHIYEDVLEWLLESSDKIELIQRGLQVYRPLPKAGKQTLGEFDFIVSLGDRVVHLELATKFYLQVEKDGGVYFPGPDARDNWERKRVRMVEHQFGIGYLPEAKELLKNEYGIVEFDSEHLIYGCLFHHVNAKATTPEGVSESAHWGKWLEPKEYDRVIGEQNIWFLPEHLWPCPPSREMLEFLQPISKSELMEKVQRSCVMFTNGSQRFFLVSQLWLDTVYKS